MAEAERRYRDILRSDPRHAPTLSYLGLLEAATGRLAGLERMRQALEIAPGIAVLWLNYGLALRDAGRSDAAEQALRRAVERMPDNFDAQIALGNLLRGRDRLDEAIACFRAAAASRPDFYGGHLALGGALNDAHRHGKAVPVLETARRLAADVPEVHVNLGLALANDNRSDEAIASFRRAAALKPGYVFADWHAALTLPRIYRHQDEITEWRDRWAGNLARLAAELDLSTPAAVDAAARAIWSGTNFFLHYQGCNDRELQERYGRLVARIVAARHPAHVEPLDYRPAGDRLRVGFMSAHFRHHSIAKTHAGWITGLERRRHEIFVIHTGGESDGTTARLAAGCEHFHHRPVVDAGLFDFIRSLRLDVLIYPDIGMAPAYQVLAALRLAPLQCNGLGHPITAGMPTIDVALSSASMEPQGAASHYSERLVLLANTGFSYGPVDLPAPAADARRGKAGVVYVCSQYLSKLLPGDDVLFARIAGAVPGAEFWFVSDPSPAVTRCFEARMHGCFKDAGVGGDRRIRMLPRMNQADFYAMYRTADVVLDGHAWSGCNTTFEAVACGLPVVTWPGAMMRGRHSMAILRQLGLSETIADSATGFVDIAVRLGREPDARDDIAERMRRSGTLLFNDPAPIASLASFLEQAAR